MMFTQGDLEALSALASRFDDLSLEYRRSGVEWPNPWRLVVVSSKHSNARVVAFGDTPGLAISQAQRLADEAFK